jgi:hypothetical protein
MKKQKKNETAQNGSFTYLFFPHPPLPSKKKKKQIKTSNKKREF